MEYRNLGPTGLDVSAICLGTMQFKWTADESASYAVLDSFYESGGNFIDTADIYSNWAPGLSGGEAETVIGEWMKRKGNRSKIILATKVRGKMWDGPDGEGLSRAHIMRAVEDSLRRLQTDTIDLYQSHWPDTDTRIEETMRAFDDLVKQGKARFVGCSNYSGDQLAEALQASKRDGLIEYTTIQPHWSLVERQKFELETYPTVKIYGLGIIPYSPLGRGFLTGKYRANKPLPKSLRIESVRPLLNNKNFILLDKLEAIGKARGKSIAQIALGWLLARDQVVSVIIGANTPEQLADSLGASGLRLTDDEMYELNRLTSWATGILSTPVS
ncbi:MAG: aldo/keto reductase [Chloroflexi bacterium]|nr:aldo/keto reductase [Chloroflexota bacterium]